MELAGACFDFGLCDAMRCDERVGFYSFFFFPMNTACRNLGKKEKETERETPLNDNE